jgi:hypothetical protein
MSNATEIPETRYVKSGELYIAYQVFGAGSVDLVYVPGFVSHTSSVNGGTRRGRTCCAGSDRSHD